MTKRVDLSLSEKVKLVSELDLPGVTQASVAKKYGVSTSRRCHACLKRRRILFVISRGGNRSRKRKSEGKEDVGNALFLWFEQKLGLGARLSRPLLKQKACDLALTQELTTLELLLFTLITQLKFNYGI